MAMVATFKFDDFVTFGIAAQAKRMADIVASVPELTILTISIDGISWQTNSARSISNDVGAPET